MSTSCAGVVTSVGGSFGFLVGLLGRGRLAAPPTASLTPHKHTHINAKVANKHCQTPAILKTAPLRVRPSVNFF